MSEILGYTTINNKWGTLMGKECAKHDLLLEIYTRRGECDWNPNFGTTIIDKIFQLKTESVKNEIIAELQNVIADNPLFQLVGLSTTEIDGGWLFNLTISYLGGIPESWVLPINEATAKKYQ